MNFREFPPSREEIISLLVILIESFFLYHTLHVQIDSVMITFNLGFILQMLFIF